jgi:hypothetical protein
VDKRGRAGDLRTKLEQKRCEEDFERLPLPSTHTIELTGC